MRDEGSDEVDEGFEAGGVVAGEPGDEIAVDLVGRGGEEAEDTFKDAGVLRSGKIAAWRFEG